MYIKKIPILIICVISSFIFSQNQSWQNFHKLIGKWSGIGAGFSSGKSQIKTEIKYVMNEKYLQITNRSEFEPTAKNPEGDIHEDWGMLSYDKNRKKYVFRQFHNEGFVNKYILNDSLSTDSLFIFESDMIENFVPGGKTIFKIKVINIDEIETIFEISFNGKDFDCYGKNLMIRRE